MQSVITDIMRLSVQKCLGTGPSALSVYVCIAAITEVGTESSHVELNNKCVTCSSFLIRLSLVIVLKWLRYKMNNTLWEVLLLENNSCWHGNSNSA